MAPFIIVGFIVASLLFLWIWPKIRVEEVVYLPESWNPDASRGRVVQKRGGYFWEVKDEH